MALKKDDNVKVVIDNKHFKGKEGKIVKTTTKFIDQKAKEKYGKKILVTGKGLAGANEFKGKCPTCNCDIYEAIPDSRWFYEEQLEKK